MNVVANFIRSMSFSSTGNSRLEVTNWNKCSLFQGVFGWNWQFHAYSSHSLNIEQSLTSWKCLADNCVEKSIHIDSHGSSWVWRVLERYISQSVPSVNFWAWYPVSIPANHTPKRVLFKFWTRRKQGKTFSVVCSRLNLSSMFIIFQFTKLLGCNALVQDNKTGYSSGTHNFLQDVKCSQIDMRFQTYWVLEPIEVQSCACTVFRTA